MAIDILLRKANPNLFWFPGDNNLVIIDHNQAFDLSTEKKVFSNLHVFSSQNPELSGDFFRRDEYNIRLDKALGSWQDIIETIPTSWWFEDKEETIKAKFDANTIYNLLNEFRNDDFWNWK